MPAFVVWFEELSKSSVSFAGGKGANLGEMTRAGLPVPGGFVVTTASFLAALDAGSVRGELREIFEGVDADSPQALAEASAKMRGLIQRAGVPEEVRAAIAAAYGKLGAHTAVAVRSSATSEDTGSTSFAGMHETFTNVIGEAALIEKIVACWMSAYGQRVIAYRKAERMDEEPTIAVVVQKMIDSARSGVMFTADPASGDRGTIVIEAAFGLGEVVVGGQVEVDTYVVDKKGPAVRSARVGRKAFKIVREGQGETKVSLGTDEANRRVLSDAEVALVAQLGMKVEAHYGAPQDLEWAEEGGSFYLVQTRPITTLGAAAGPAAGTVLVTGLGASPGVASGKVRVLTSPDEGEQLKAGEVLVAPMTSPDWVPRGRGIWVGPSSVGTSISAPRAAWLIVTGTRQMR